MEKKSVVMSENQNFLRVRINLFASFTFPELLRSNVYELRGVRLFPLEWSNNVLREEFSELDSRQYARALVADVTVIRARQKQRDNPRTVISNGVVK